MDSGETSTTSYKNNPAFFMHLERTKGVGSLPAFSDFVYHGEIGSQPIYARVCTRIPHRLKRSPSSADRPLGRSLENVTAQDCTQIIFIMTENVTLSLSQSVCEDHSRRVQTCIAMSSIAFCPHFVFFPPVRIHQVCVCIPRPDVFHCILLYT